MKHLSRQLFLALLALCLSSCSISNQQEAFMPTKTKAIIFIPGFKGSFLANQHGYKRWVTAEQAIFGTTSLALPNEDIGIRNEELTDAGVIHEVPIVPFLYSQRVYKSILSFLKKKLPQYSIVEFSYDWRVDFIDTLKRLDQTILDLRASGVKSISIIAHSMGGMLTTHYLRYGLQDPSDAQENWYGLKNIDSVVFAGTPFQGSLEIFDDMQWGLLTGINSSLLNAEAYSSFLTSYYLLPTTEQLSVLNQQDQKIDIYDVSNWHKNKWGLFSNYSHEAAKFEFTKFYLNRASEYHALRNSSSNVAPGKFIKILNIVGIGLKTQNIAQWNEEKRKLRFRTFSEHEEAKLDGDIVVTARSAELPESLKQNFSNETIYTKQNHVTLFRDGLVKAALLKHFS